jgi:hypothetical protein
VLGFSHGLRFKGLPRTANRGSKDEAFDYPIVVEAQGLSSRGSCHAKRPLATAALERTHARRLAVALAQRLGDYEQVRDAIHSRAAT